MSDPRLLPDGKELPLKPFFSYPNLSHLIRADLFVENSWSSKLRKEPSNWVALWDRYQMTQRNYFFTNEQTGQRGEYLSPAQPKRVNPDREWWRAQKYSGTLQNVMRATLKHWSRMQMIGGL